jgi:hypothetical protein
VFGVASGLLYATQTSTTTTDVIASARQLSVFSASIGDLSLPEEIVSAFTAAVGDAIGAHASGDSRRAHDVLAPVHSDACFFALAGAVSPTTVSSALASLDATSATVLLLRACILYAIDVTCGHEFDLDDAGWDVGDVYTSVAHVPVIGFEFAGAPVDTPVAPRAPTAPRPPTASRPPAKPMTRALRRRANATSGRMTRARSGAIVDRYELVEEPGADSCERTTRARTGAIADQLVSELADDFGDDNLRAFCDAFREETA